MRNAYRLLLGSVLTLLATAAPLAEDISPPPNYQGLWWNAPAGSESGWGINLAHQGDVIFATWFTYDAGGEGWWLAMTANKTAAGTYAGTLLETHGPAFTETAFMPSSVYRVTVGSGTLSFSDAANGTFTYDVRGVQQKKSITRQVFGSQPTCTYEAQPNYSVITNYQDLWWAAGGTQSGWGVNLAHQGDVLFATWFTYDRDGTPMWLAANATLVAPRVYSGKLIRTTGPAFFAEPFDPAKVMRTEVGTATFAFAHGNAATFTYSLEGVARTKQIARQLFAPPAGTVCRQAETPSITGKVFDGNLEGALVCADANANARCDTGEVQAITNAQGTYELKAPAGYRGALVAEVIAGQTRDAGAIVDRAYRMISPAREYSTNITPFTTMVALTRERDYRLAEEMVRNELGLPPGFRINLDAAPADGSLTQVATKSVVDALKATAATIDPASPDAFGAVVAALPPAVTGMPQLRITTKNGVPIESKEVYVDATFTLTYPAASLPQADLNGKIRGRGNTTWREPKKPYKIQFTNDAAYAKMPDFLGMKKSRNWALLADHLDRSLMRNQLAFTLGNSGGFADGLKWTSSGQHLEVWLNGDYVGVYLLTEDIRIDPARLNIRKMSASPAANETDGGYIAEVDFPLDCFNNGVLNLQHVTPEGAHICVDTPDEEAITTAQLAYIKKLLDTVEKDIYSGSELDKINPASFADWYLLQELFRSQDAPFYSSDFMWKDTGAANNPADRLLNMGPLWDFDITAGNTNMYEAWKTEGCWVTQSREGMTNWFMRLFDHRDFLDLTLARWKEKRPALEKLINASIETFARRLDEPQRRNFERWPVLSAPMWIDYYYFPTYGEHVAFLKRYLNERMAWLDRAFENSATFAAYCK